MKKLVIVLGIIIILVLAAAAIVPLLFKDDIKKAVDDALAESVNADIVWDTDDFSISLFTNFPNATAGLHNFGIINRAPFEGEILFAVESFEVEIDLFSLFGDQIKINGIELDHPEINIKVLEDGSANYDIAISSEPTVEEAPSEDAPAKFNVGIDHWSISRAHIVYEDATLPFEMEIKNLNHSGSGDFTQDIFDIISNTSIDSVSTSFDGVEYLSDKRFSADITINISDNFGKYTFKENAVSLNDFVLSFDGWLALNEDGSIDMDMSYGAKETTFKSLLSLVPGIYTQDFASINTEGLLAFDGIVKGTYDSLNLPAFSLGLQVNDAMFKYPDLPTSISNISMDLLVDNQDGNIDNTVVDLKQFHLDFGNNPIDAKLRIANLVNYDMDAEVKAKLNLAELSSMFPMDGMQLKGIYSLEANAAGVYDSVSGKTPTIDAAMNLTNGYVKTADLPYALEDLAFKANIQSPTGLMKDFNASVKDFGMTMDGEPFRAQVEFANLENYTWKVSAGGGIDLEKITKVFPLEGMQIAGKVKADITTAGNMQDLEAERYANLPTSGSASLNEFSYEDDALPYRVTISNLQASFDPQKITLENYEGTVGKSDMKMTGSLSNYIGYLFGEGEVLKGKLNFSSNVLDLNEFMEEEDGVSEPTEEESGSVEDFGVFEVPNNIDFVLTSRIAKVEVMDMVMNNASGDVIVRNGIVNLSDLKFNMLDGDFALSGTYDPRDIEKPKYDFNFSVDELSAQKAFETFTIVQSYFPLAKNINGNLSTDFKIRGLLDEEMFPDMKTVSGSGLLNIAQAKVTNSKVLKGIGSLTSVSSLSDTEEVSIKDILMDVTIEDGKVNVKPFDMKLAGYSATVSGSSFLDGTLDYNLKVDVPAGKLGAAANNLIAQYTGGSGSDGNTVIPLSFGIGGTHTDPKPTLKTTVQKQQVVDLAKNVAKDKVEEQTGVDLEEEKEKRRTEIISEAQKRADQVTEEGKRAADKMREEGYAQADRLVKEAGSNFLKKKIAEEAAKKLRKETDDKADKLENEAKSKAEAIMEEARKKADSI